MADALFRLRIEYGLGANEGAMSLGQVCLCGEASGALLGVYAQIDKARLRGC
jgi:hypothetical protein